MIRSASVLVSVILLSLAPALSRAADTAFLPEVSVHLKAARYAPSETDFEWTGWIGAGASLVRIDGTTGYFDADVETILGNQRRLFEATQANYHLELGLRRTVGPGEAILFFHHVSRHAVDRFKDPAVDWNVLGLRVTGRLPEGSKVPARLTLGLGHTTLASLVGYRWEATFGADAEFLQRAWGELYGRSDLRLVTARRSDAFPRSRFLDLTFEGGVRLARSARCVETFLAFERRNDVLLESAATRSRLLVGFRIGSGNAPTPSSCGSR